MPKKRKAKSILNKTKRRDAWFLDDYTVNPYSACSFNCLFCFIRGSKYGTHMGTALEIKTNAPELLEKQLSIRARKNEYGFIVLSSATDPYLKAESEYRLTQQMLEVIWKYKFPVHIITRSDLVIRDLEILNSINEDAILPSDLAQKLKGTLVTFSFSTIEDSIAQIFEPGATPPSARIEAVQKIKESGLKTGISFMPMIPYITDTTEQLTASFEVFKKVDVDYILPATIALYGEGKADSKTLVLGAIEKHYPELVPKYQRLFSKHNELPAYYREAFDKKMDEMCATYGIKRAII
ncbi:SPL family radical SAM protein [Fulvivirga lutea]|uniref:Radical SAM protein n=1 Tax=Fulvivirga lutea TaxID=2810512 RepID=A0A975A2F3_9BACT|nr:radical SAM protein [Fulvivirga lutea]QSE99235.1 radical SAM protein [Fulvivirga lutea]